MEPLNAAHHRKPQTPGPEEVTMHGLETLRHLNDVEAAKFLRRRYEKLRRRAVSRQDWVRAQRYDRDVTDLGRFINGQIPVFPNRKNREKGLYQASTGRDFSKGDSNERKAASLH